MDYIYYGGTKEDWENISISDYSIDAATVILYKQKPESINVTPSDEDLAADNDAGDPNADAMLYEFRQDVLKAFNIRRAKAGLKPFRMNIKQLNEIAQQKSEDQTGTFNVYETMNQNKLYGSKAYTWGGFAYRELVKMQNDDWFPDLVLSEKYKAIGVGLCDGEWCIIFIG